MLPDLRGYVLDQAAFIKSLLYDLAQFDLAYDLFKYFVDNLMY
jgi:hypothetical protein